LPRRPSRKLTAKKVQVQWPIFYKYWAGYYATASHKVRTRYASNFRKIATPMLPILRHFYMGTSVSALMTEGRVVGFFRPMVTEITGKLEEILSVREISRETIGSALRASLPRIEAFRRLFSLAGADVDDIERAAERLVHLAADHAYKLRRALETQRAKYAYRGMEFKLPTFMKLVQPTAVSLPDPTSFSIIVDFSTAGAVGPFLKSLLGGLANDKRYGQAVMNQLSQIFGEQLELTAKGVIRRRGASGRMRALKFDELERAASQIIPRLFSRKLVDLFKEAVRDIFFIEPTSVSRWFPARPMARKSLNSDTGLAHMLYTVQVVFKPITGGSRKGYAGAFTGFDTQKAPYWHVVQYGYHGSIEPTTSPFLTLKDPDPEWWTKVQWLFGARTRPDILKERSITTSRTGGTSYHPHFSYTKQGRIRYKRKPVEFGSVRIPVMMPSGYPRFTMKLHHSAEIMKIREKRRVLTYRITITPQPIRKRRVKGQRASLFIERILAKIAERQKVLEPELFNAATAFVSLAEKEWNRVASVFAAGGYKLGG